MAVNLQYVTNEYALYNGDCIEILPSIPADSVHMTIYSPPFAGLYQYSSSDNDLSNCTSYDQFMDHYRFVVREMNRVTMPGRLSCVHVSDVPNDRSLIDFPGDVVRLHESEGFEYHGRISIWKEPLRVAIRTRSLALRHSQLVKDATLCRPVLADYVLLFKKRGTNPVPVEHPNGITYYAGSDPLPEYLREKYGSWATVLHKYRNHKDPATNKLAHIIWQRYASCMWDDIRIDNVLSYRNARESEEEKHVHPLQLDVIDRCVLLWTNPGETVLTPFGGVMSEVFSPVSHGRRGIGIELKETYYRQGVENMKDAALRFADQDQMVLF